MSPAKQRRYLIGFSIACFSLWIVTSFGPMTWWFFTGGFSEPTSKEVSASLCLLYWQMLKENVFSDAPGLGSGYLFLGLFMLYFLSKTKTKSDDKDDA